MHHTFIVERYRLRHHEHADRTLPAWVSIATVGAGMLIPLIALLLEAWQRM
ncbi:hypothetical protein [Hymenobacter latericus]|uniref:hypothetical protein n=1 Tax=Hymenobacter sp. YIM 151858-1 TaxID=2987688 RepID=UPI00222605E3|nr:hypothetical protein [Hymenobacter sp. YIM 151858-1]UYZ59668.1 hypothetical protein OIS50_02455 [Hymenobacter sp. YIM 151858-1]